MEPRLPEAQRQFDEALRIAGTGGFRDIAVQSRTLLGVQSYWRGDFAESIATCRDAETTAREIHDGFNEVFAMSTRAFSHVSVGEYREAFEVMTAGRALARERDNHYIVGRFTNTLGWLHQEFGDFEGARELDRESADLAHRIKNGNVELRALINLGFDDLHAGATPSALSHFEETMRLAEKALGAHKWRSVIHLRLGLATALLALGRDAQALEQAELGLVDARATDSRKYVGWFHLVQGEAALRAGQAAVAVGEADAALRVGRAIGYPTLAWQAAHLLAQAQAAAGQPAAGLAAATLARETLQQMLAAAPRDELRRALQQWPRAQTVHDTLHRLRVST